MSWLVLSWALTLGMSPGSSGVGIVDPNYLGREYKVFNDNAISTKLEIEAAAWSHLRAWGSMEIKSTIDSNMSTMGAFSPYEGYFIAGLAFYVKGFEVGIKHECDHGIESLAKPVLWVTSGGTDIYVKISGKTSF